MHSILRLDLLVSIVRIWIYEVPATGSCTSNFCLNPGSLTVVANAAGSLGWNVFCPTDPVASEGVDWGTVKSLY